MAAKHTPGPWSALRHEPGDTIIIADMDGGCDDLAEVFYSGRATVQQPHDEALANARLIAAAPDLLAALQEALPAIANRERHNRAKDAIAKATGAA